MPSESSFNGITMLNFFSGNAAPFNRFVTCGSLDVLLPGQGTTRGGLGGIFSGEFAGGWTFNDLSFFSAIPVFDFTFNTLEPAFTGQATENLAVAAGMPMVGATGTIISGEPDNPTVLGRWEIISEATPSNCLLFSDSFESGDTSRWTSALP